ncbi:MAG: hypothetical protein K2M31_04305 [Muribaculaceae bacterium]|nr:hypothetical protein [Muribaculaceae bacterium]
MYEINGGLLNPDYDKDSLYTSMKNNPDGYSIEDDDDEEKYISDDSNLPEYSDEDEEEEDENDPEDEDEIEDSGDEPHRKSSAIGLLIAMMLNPIEGWKRIRRQKTSPEVPARNCFFPLVALAAVSCFMECVYNSATNLSMAIVEAVKIFVALFFGNFLGLAFVKMVMPNNQKKIADSDYGKKYMMYLLSTLAIFFILYECLPMVGPVIAFTPLWTVYLAMRGAKFFRFPEEKKNLLTALMCIIVVGAPFIVYSVFDIFLPN